MKFVWMAALAALAIGCTTQQAAVKADAPVATMAPAQAEPEKAEAHAGMQPPLADATGAKKAFDAKPQPGEKAICAVSEEPFEVTAETKTAEYNGKWYAFCCDQCAPEFAADPAKFAN